MARFSMSVINVDQWYGLRMAGNENTCPDCGIEMDQIEKTTFTGREMREYQCPRCKRTQIVDCGEALWKILSDANKPDQE